jgi:hypothetical protein
METQIRTLRQEAQLVDSMTHYELLEDDPGGYRFTQGWVLGLERAVEMLRGAEPLDGDQIMDLGASRMTREGTGS